MASGDDQKSRDARNRKIFIALIVLLVLILMGVLFYYRMFGNKPITTPKYRFMYFG
jgi:flagellar basal body-associated protein FliL